MNDKWDEITQMKEAYAALKTQPRDAQIRMLQWLGDRLESEYRAAMKEREATAKKRIASGKTGDAK